MKIALIYNEDIEGVINTFGMQNKEWYNPATVTRVADALERGGHNVGVFDGNMHIIERIRDFMPRVLDGERLGMVFNMAYGIQGESRYTHIPSLLEMLGIPYVGSSPSGHALALDKVITKILMQKHGVSTPEFWVFSSADEPLDDVSFPVIVKPKMESVSFGLRVVHDKEALREAIAYVVEEFQQQALVEHFVRGREFCVGLIGNSPVEAFPVLEIDLEGDPDAIQSVEDKKEQPRAKICPANIPDDLAEEMVRQSIDAFRALQLRDFSRVDLRLDEGGKIHLLEINSMASLGDTGSYVHAAEKYGLDFDGLVNRILDVAAVRYVAAGHPSSSTEPATAQPLSIRARGFLRGRQTNQEALLEKIVNINNHARNADGVNRVGSIVARELEALGFTQEVHPNVEVGNNLLFSNTEDTNYDVLLLGSLDVATSLGRQRKFARDGHRITGTGVWEQASGLIILISALQSLRFLRVLRKKKVAVLLSADQSLQSSFSKELISRVSSSSKHVLSLSGGGHDGALVRSRSGSAVYDVEFTEETKTAAELSAAAARFAKAIEAWCELSVDDSELIIAPSHLEVHTALSRNHCHGTAQLSVRFTSQATFEGVEKRLTKKIPSKHLKGSSWDVRGGLKRPPFQDSGVSNELWDRIASTAKGLDLRAVGTHRWNSSGICFVDTKAIPAVDGFGAAGGTHEEDGEYILSHSLLERSLLLAMLVKDL